MNKTIPILLCSLISLLPLNADEEISLSDYGFKGTTDKELINELAERVFLLEQQMGDLQSQVEVTKKEVFEKHGQHITQLGDTFSKIATSYEIELKELIEMNPDIDPRRLRLGQIVKVRKEIENRAAYTTPASAPR